MKKMMIGLVIGLVLLGSGFAGAADKVDPAWTAYLTIKAQWEAGQTTNAQVAFHAILDGNPCRFVRVHVERMLAACLAQDGKLVEAQAAFEALIRDYPEYQDLLASARTQIAYLLTQQGKPVEANAQYMRCVEDYARALGAPNEASVIWVAFKQVNSNLLTVEQYRTFLSNALKGTAATKENAEFLGLLKSELGKLP